MTMAMQRARPIMIRPTMYSGIAAKEEDGQDEHQDRADDPVLHQRQRQDLAVAEDVAQFLVFHLGQRRIHHQDEADGDGDVGRARLGTG